MEKQKVLHILSACVCSLSYAACKTHAPPCGLSSCIVRSKRDGTRAENRFGLSAKRMSPFKSAGVSVQSTTGGRGMRISGQQLYRPCSDVQCMAAGYPLHSYLSPSHPLPCVTVCHQVPKALYHIFFHIASQTARLKKKKRENIKPARFYPLYNFCLKYFSF